MKGPNNVRHARSFLAVLAGMVMLSAPAVETASKFVSNTRTIPFNSEVFVDGTTAPEWVFFSGALEVVTWVAAPTVVCTALNPCSVPGVMLVFPSGISGVGLTSGLKYQMLGLSLVERNLQVPGAISLQPDFTLLLPKTIKPVGRPLANVAVETVVTFDPIGNILQAAAPPSGLVSWWQAEGTADDALGLNPGTLSSAGSVSFVPGKIGQAFHFDGQGFVEVPDSPTLEPVTVTTAAWVRAGASPGPFDHILSKGASNCDGSSYAFYTGSDGGLQFYVFDGTTVFASPSAGPGVWDGNWHFVAGTFDGATVRLYVDGAEVGTGTSASAAIKYGLATSNMLFIGAYPGTCPLPFTGDVDEVQIFGRALSAPEVQGLYEASQ